MNNTSRQGVLTFAIELWSFGSLEGVLNPHFGSVNVILTLFQKWGCDMGGMWRGSPLLSHFQAQGKVTPLEVLYLLWPIIFPQNQCWAPNYIFPSLTDDTHIMGPMNEITRTFDHLLTQLTLVGLRVKVSCDICGLHIVATCTNRNGPKRNHYLCNYMRLFVICTYICTFLQLFLMLVIFPTTLHDTPPSSLMDSTANLKVNNKMKS